MRGRRTHKSDKGAKVGLSAALLEVANESEESLVLSVHGIRADIERGIPDEGGGNGKGHA